MARSGEAWRKRQVREVERAQNRCVARAVDRTDAVMAAAVDYIWNAYETHGTYMQPSLNELFNVSADFYRQVIEEAFDAAERVKAGPARRPRPIRLARRKGPKGIPRTLRDLEEVFRDRRYWPAILKRSKTQVDRLRSVYLKKLEQRFKRLLPKVTGGLMSPQEAKADLAKAWGASRARVATIFRTETTNYFAKTQRAYFQKDPEIIGFMFDSVRDRARTDICRSRHGLVYRPGSKELEQNTPALHYNCRSHLIPLANTPENRRLLEDPSRDPLRRTVAPLPPGWRK